jgi:ribosomal protein S18 acetylase RimI-like enzyme
MNITTKQANLLSTTDGNDIIRLLNNYACDIMGGGEQLPEHVKQSLIPALQKRTDVLIVLAYANENAAGLAICFEGFSTFYAKPLINIHDFAVEPEYRGLGIAKLMLQKVEELAKEKDACKITLEVLTGNKRAIGIYEAFGFENYQLDEKMGHAVFMQKKIS